MQLITLDQASKHLSEFIEAVMSGEEIIITKDDQPVAKLMAVPQPKKGGRRAGSAKGLVTISDDFDEPLEDFKDYM